MWQLVYCCSCPLIWHYCCSCYDLPSHPFLPADSKTAKQQNRKAEQPKASTDLHWKFSATNAKVCISGFYWVHGLTAVTLDSESIDSQFESWWVKVPQPTDLSRSDRYRRKSRKSCEETWQAKTQQWKRRGGNWKRWWVGVGVDFIINNVDSFYY